MQTADKSSQISYLLLAAVLFPAIVFFSLASWTSLNYPWLDDYNAVLGFANHLVQLHGFSERFQYFIAAQHNEYKLLLSHSFVWLELVVLGHLNFSVLNLLGDSSVAVLGYVLWRMFLPQAPLNRRLVLFLPVSLLLFQLQYSETINWPMAGLQNLTVAPLAFGSFYLLGRETRNAFVGSLACMVLGISASGNGFIISAVGIFILLLQRRYQRLAIWLTLLAGSAAVYSYRYNTRATQNPGHASLITVLIHPHGIYLLGFLGAAARTRFLFVPVLLGAALCAFFAWTIFRRNLLRQDPVLGYCLLFLLLTALGVSGLRSGFGLEQSISSRYSIYSDLLLILAWFAAVRIAVLDRTPRISANLLFWSVLVSSFLFFLRADAHGFLDLRHRDLVLKQGFGAFEKSGGRLAPVYFPSGMPAGYSGFPEFARITLLQSETLGVYQPPQ